MIISKRELVEFEARILRKMEDYNEKLDKMMESSQARFSHQHKALSIIYRKLGNLEQNNNFLSSEVNREAAKLGEINNSLNKRIESLKILEKKASKRLIDEATVEVKELVAGLAKGINEYKKLEKEFVSFGNNIGELSKEIEKFSHISKKIKETDFETSEIIKILQIEKDKNTRLKSENDKLKTIVSNQRQKSRK